MHILWIIGVVNHVDDEYLPDQCSRDVGGCSLFSLAEFVAIFSVLSKKEVNNIDKSNNIDFFLTIIEGNKTMQDNVCHISCSQSLES